MSEEQIQQLNGYSDTALEHLARLQDQIGKVIEVKKKAASYSSSNNMILRQTKDLLQAIENLEQINSKLPEAISEVKDLCQQVTLLARSEALVKPSVSGLGQRGNGRDKHADDNGNK